jgi:hypothetical protein
MLSHIMSGIVDSSLTFKCRWLKLLTRCTLFMQKTKTLNEFCKLNVFLIMYTSFALMLATILVKLQS